MKRWRLQVFVNVVGGVLIHEERFWLRRNAERTGRQITRAPLNRYEVARG
jgi:hypothetical protein